MSADRVADLDDPQLRAFAPLIYVAWSDQDPDADDRARVCSDMAKQPWLRPAVRALVEAWLAPAQKADELARLRRLIEQVATTSSDADAITPRFALARARGCRTRTAATACRSRSSDGGAIAGVRTGDSGHKMGLNGVDNSRLWFERVRVPVADLLDRFDSIDELGVYASPIASPDRLSQGEVAILAVQVHVVAITEAFAEHRVAEWFAAMPRVPPATYSRGSVNHAPVAPRSPRRMVPRDRLLRYRSCARGSSRGRVAPSRARPARPRGQRCIPDPGCVPGGADRIPRLGAPDVSGSLASLARSSSESRRRGSSRSHRPRRTRSRIRSPPRAP